MKIHISKSGWGRGLPASDPDCVDLKRAFLNCPLLHQFKANSDKLNIEVPERGQVWLQLTNFSGLNTKALDTGVLTTIEVEGFKLSGGHLTSGGPHGVLVEFRYKRT